MSDAEAADLDSVRRKWLLFMDNRFIGDLTMASIRLKQAFEGA